AVASGSAPHEVSRRPAATAIVRTAEMEEMRCAMGSPSRSARIYHPEPTAAGPSDEDDPAAGSAAVAAGPARQERGVARRRIRYPASPATAVGMSIQSATPSACEPAKNSPTMPQNRP